MTWALVPVKKLFDAKQRLSDLLGVLERKALFVAMLKDVLQALSDHPSLERVFVVSSDPGVRELAQHFGADFMDEAELYEAELDKVEVACGDLNQVVAAAAKELQCQGARQLLVVHGDLPLINSDAISAIISCLNSLGDRGLVIAADDAGQGSNCLAISPPTLIPFAYGEYSCFRHRQLALEKGVALATVNIPALAQDIDSCDDLIGLLDQEECCVARNTFAYLRQSGLFDRLRSLSDGRGSSEQNNSSGGSKDLECV
jgi:2-phospho-L-lactate guanylyltransferase